MALSSTLLTLVFAPLIITCSLVLLPIAVFTTIFALFALAARVLTIYVELIIHIAHNQFSSFKPVVRFPPSSSKRPKSVRSQSTSSGSRTPKYAYPEPTYAANMSLARDYEGVGGWRYAVDDDDNESEWVTLNARLELPAVSAIPEERTRNHKRSLTHGSLIDKPRARRRATGSRPRSALMSGTTSPEQTLREGERAKSAIFLGEAGMNIGRTRTPRRRKSSGSSSSSSSGKTLTMVGGPSS